MIFKDYYKILGLENNKANIDEIKIAYREQAKKYHPDINIGDRSTEERFKDINEAYRILSNEKNRRKYDFNWNKYIGKKKNKSKVEEKRTIKEVLLDILFGRTVKQNKQKKLAPEYGENISTEINVSIKEAFYGAKKVVKLRTVDGKETSFSFSVPAGIQNHDKIRVIGHGKEGKNGGKNGDLFVVINIVDEKNLKLVGSDLYTELSLNTYDAALGKKCSIEILDEKIDLIIPECTSSGNSFTVRQKGYKDGKGSRGNLHIVAKIIIPNKLNKDIQEMYKKIKELSTMQ